MCSGRNSLHQGHDSALFSHKHRVLRISLWNLNKGFLTFGHGSFFFLNRNEVIVSGSPIGRLNTKLFNLLVCCYLNLLLVSVSGGLTWKKKPKNKNHSTAWGPPNNKTFNLCCLMHCSQWHDTVWCHNIKKLPGLHRCILMMRSVCRPRGTEGAKPSDFIL